MWYCNFCRSANPDSGDLVNVWVNEGSCNYCGAPRYAAPKRGGCLKTIVVFFIIVVLLSLLFSCQRSDETNCSKKSGYSEKVSELLK
jgi:hypothetical protein